MAFKFHAEKNQFKEMAGQWDHTLRYSPAPRHRRIMILRMLRGLQFADFLDAGCAQGYLLQAIKHRYNAKAYGCDISTSVINQNKLRMPDCEFMALDLAKEKWANNKQFDLVVNSEVVEHIKDWKMAINHLASMARHFLLITVPSGKVRTVDKLIGHFRHFEADEMVSEIERHGFICTHVFRHGFPVHSLYRRLIDHIAPFKIHQAFQNGKEYSFVKKMFSHAIYFAFYIDYLFSTGDQLFILAKRQTKLSII